MSGTVNISRDIWDDQAFKPEPFTEREAWVWMIMEASYKRRSKPVGNIWVDLERGQLACSVRFMCDAWQWSKSRVDRFLKRLENRDMIGTDSGTGVNVITICKYNEYQNRPSDSGTPDFQKRDSSGTAAGQQRDKPNTGLIQGVIQGKEDAGASSPTATANPSRPRSPKSKAETQAEDCISELSKCVSAKTAQDFVQHRSELKKPLTALAASRIVNKLKSHPDPEAVLDLSIQNGWQGIFPEKVEVRNGSANHSSFKVISGGGSAGGNGYGGNQSTGSLVGAAERFIRRNGEMPDAGPAYDADLL